MLLVLIYLVYTIILLSIIVLFLIEVQRENNFIKNYLEIDATIGKVLMEKWLYENRFRRDEPRMYVTFSYSINDREYETVYYLPNDDSTTNYYDKYKKIGETFSILVNAKRQNHIPLPEKIYLIKF